MVQGFTQLLEMHAWNEGHSSSEEQPASMGAARNGLVEILIIALNVVNK